MNVIDKKKYKKNLEILREKINFYEKISKKSIQQLLRKRSILNKQQSVKSKLCKINELNDWKINNGKIVHKSGQFFSVEGVKIKNAKREVSSWDQVILNQKHGGILAIIMRETKSRGIEFLLNLRSEPGDKDLKFCPSFSATQSNINLAHGGKKTDLSEIILKLKGAEIIAKSTHNEEGARFWRKKNENWIVKIKDPFNKEISKENFVWVNYWQIKKLTMEDCVINPFVKTILFMI